MNVEQKTLLDELESLRGQKADKMAQLQQIDGAERMILHLLSKVQQPANAELMEQLKARGATIAPPNGVPADETAGQ